MRGRAPSLARSTPTRRGTLTLSGFGRDAGERLRLDIRERFRASVPMRGVVADARLRIILETIQQHRAHPGFARGIEFLGHVGQEQDVAGVAVQPPGDFAIAAGVALVADFGIEEAVEQGLKLLLQKSQQQKIRDLRGKLHWEDDLVEMRKTGVEA